MQAAHPLDKVRVQLIQHRQRPESVGDALVAVVRGEVGGVQQLVQLLQVLADEPRAPGAPPGAPCPRSLSTGSAAHAMLSQHPFQASHLFGALVQSPGMSTGASVRQRSCRH